MSLLDADGKPFVFDTPIAPLSASTSATTDATSNEPRAPPAAPVFAVSTRNAFQFVATDAQPMSDAQIQHNQMIAAAAATPASALFSSQPISLAGSSAAAAPLTFAPSNPQRKPKDASSVGGVDFSEFDDEIASMEAAKRAELQEQLAVNAARIASETRGTAALPSQIGDSALFHQRVLQQYGKVHHLDEVNPKKAFESKKAKAREARAKKKAEDRADQMEAKTGGALRKNKHKNRAKGVY